MARMALSRTLGSAWRRSSIHWFRVLLMKSLGPVFISDVGGFGCAASGLIQAKKRSPAAITVEMRMTRSPSCDSFPAPEYQRRRVEGNEGVTKRGRRHIFWARVGVGGVGWMLSSVRTRTSGNRIGWICRGRWQFAGAGFFARPQRSPSGESADWVRFSLHVDPGTGGSVAIVLPLPGDEPLPTVAGF